MELLKSNKRKKQKKILKGLYSRKVQKKRTLKAADILKTHGLTATVADARFAKPIDTDMILRLARDHDVLVTVEEGSIGGFGAQVLHTLAENGAPGQRTEGSLDGSPGYVYRSGQPCRDVCKGRSRRQGHRDARLRGAWPRRRDQRGAACLITCPKKPR